MRRLIILLALIASSALFLGAPSSASAANCTTPNAGGLKNSAGQINYTASVNGCTSDVDKIRFKYNVCDVYTCTAGEYTYYSGVYDYYIYGAYAWMYIDHQGGNFDKTINVLGGGYGGSVLLIRNCWWSGGFVDTLTYHFWYQIHNSSGGGSWGSYHHYIAPGSGTVAC